ncbi:MAG: vitamin K epoxide reductase family protein [Chthoniobacterales bacterium]
MSRRTKKERAPDDAARRSRAITIIYSIAAVIAICGLGDAVYLTIAHLTGETLVCGGSLGCSKVLGSKFAHIGPVPLASIGALGYFTAFSCATFAAFGYARARTFFAAIVWLMFAATLWLLSVQAFILHSFCRYCLVSAALVFVLAALVVLVPPQRTSVM